MNATSTIEEVRFDLRDEQITHVYVLSRAGGDAPIGVQGWHYKAFPARIPMVEILTPEYIGDYIMWPLKAPESPRRSASTFDLEPGEGWRVQP